MEPQTELGMSNGGNEKRINDFICNGRWGKFVFYTQNPAGFYLEKKYSTRFEGIPIVSKRDLISSEERFLSNHLILA